MGCPLQICYINTLRPKVCFTNKRNKLRIKLRPVTLLICDRPGNKSHGCAPWDTLCFRRVVCFWKNRLGKIVCWYIGMANTPGCDLCMPYKEESYGPLWNSVSYKVQQRYQQRIFQNFCYSLHLTFYRVITIYEVFLPSQKYYFPIVCYS